MTKRIVGVLGLGIFGSTVARELSQLDQEVIAIDNDENLVQGIADTVTKAAIGDITDSEFLKAVGIDQCDTVVIATGNHLEASVLAILHCKKFGIPSIIAKAKNMTTEEVLYGIGATKVITPERDSGKNLVSAMLRHHIENILHLEENLTLIEFTIPASWIGKNLIQLKVRQKYGLNIVGIRKADGQLDTQIPPKEDFQANIEIVAIATNDTFEKFDYLGYLK